MDNEFWDSIPPISERTIEKREIINFSEQKRHVITFQDNDGKIFVNKKYGNSFWLFNIETDGHNGLIAISSKRLMSQLRDYRPLKGKKLSVERFGTGYDTLYTLETWEGVE